MLEGKTRPIPGLETVRGGLVLPQLSEWNAIPMRRLILPVGVLILVLVGLLVSENPREVHGVVRSELDDQPIAHALVEVGSRTLYTDRLGDYRLGWVRGRLTVTVSADGYLPVHLSLPQGTRPGIAVSLPVFLVPNTVSGVVRDAETTGPLPACRVAAGEQLVATDKEGRFVLRAVKMGSSVSVTLPGYEHSSSVFYGQDVLDVSLQPKETTVHILDLYTGQALPAAQFVHGQAILSPDSEGMLYIKRLLPGTPVSVHAAGYAATDFVYDGSSLITVALRPNTLHGMVSDERDGQPVEAATVSLLSAGTVVASTNSDAQGRYTFSDVPAAITIAVAAAGYDRLEIPVGPVTDLGLPLQPFQARGIYIPLGILTNEQRVRELLDMVHNTELNAIVVDVKNDRGWLAYPSVITEAQQSQAYRPEVMDIARFLAMCREKDIYTIARLVVFKDSALAVAYPEWAVRTEEDELWRDTEGSAWGDPFRAKVQNYNVAIAKEVAALGFDELQFDYLRFPSDGAIDKVKYSEESTLESRCRTIRDFCALLRRELQPYAVLLSADLFGLTVWVSPETDMGIGQRVIDIAPYMDYLSPMLYPATFVTGNLGYQEPLRHPYEVVHRSCVELTKRVQELLASLAGESGVVGLPENQAAQVLARRGRVRPWLQHYSWSGVTYGVEEINLQKKAADDAGTFGWLFWHAGGKYD
ncbi:MAG: hypothetical protein FJ026_10540, partial [Chloroflexi bacterium]|nr:hypothetical protein [Chloroflexota bacterium]